MMSIMELVVTGSHLKSANARCQRGSRANLEGSHEGSHALRNGDTPSFSFETLASIQGLIVVWGDVTDFIVLGN